MTDRSPGAVIVARVALVTLLGMSGIGTRASMRAWLAPAKVRRRFSRVDGDAWRRSTIERLVPGKSFLDMGGMWGINGGMAFHAEQAGANRVVLCDGMDPTPEFIERQLQSLGWICVGRPTRSGND